MFYLLKSFCLKTKQSLNLKTVSRCIFSSWSGIRSVKKWKLNLPLCWILNIEYFLNTYLYFKTRFLLPLTQPKSYNIPLRQLHASVQGGVTRIWQTYFRFYICCRSHLFCYTGDLIEMFEFCNDTASFYYNMQCHIFFLFSFVCFLSQNTRQEAAMTDFAQNKQLRNLSLQKKLCPHNI